MQDHADTARLQEQHVCWPPDAARLQEQYVCRLPDAARLHAAQTLRECESRRSNDIHKIQEWLRTQPKLHARSDAGSVLRFLRGCKFNEERTRHKLTNFYVMKAKVPEWFSSRDPLLPPLQEMLNLGVFLPLRRHGADGALTILIRTAVHNPQTQALDGVFKVGNMVVDALLEEDELVSVYGVVAVCDLAGVSLGHARQLTPSIIKKAVHSWQSCYPIRIKSMVFINAPFHVGVILNIFKRFMTEKLRKRVQIFYKGTEYLKGIPSPDLLPQEYGGEAGKLQDLIDYWREHMVELRDWLLEEEKYKADVS
ncbi:retinol-binding protein pinta-like [Bacillus rossius redtenbacheri]|uniref:retinol-binding protein pinta-like n=1 Tax=Bacillus rossius redtenbacheri TaxID=93214 RepID=UPI002FDE73E5